ncbi:MAG: helix-turn-helix transcriptional regulator [Azoarcus sp.]|nr:helix-turn-helix transcriptional regulator [Azoarcus sp.]
MDTKPIYGYAQYPHIVYCWMQYPDMDIKQTVAKNLAAWMAASPSLDTIKKLAARSGVSYGTIQRARNAEANLTLDNLEGLSAAFGRTVAELIAEAIEFSPENSQRILQAPPAQPATYAAQPRREYAISWPFPHASESAYQSLPDDAKLWVQGRLDAAIEQAHQQFASQTEKRSA